jgi:hypothetical protein
MNPAGLLLNYDILGHRPDPDGKENRNRLPPRCAAVLILGGRCLGRGRTPAMAPKRSDRRRGPPSRDRKPDPAPGGDRNVRRHGCRSSGMDRRTLRPAGQAHPAGDPGEGGGAKARRGPDEFSDFLQPSDSGGFGAAVRNPGGVQTEAGAETVHWKTRSRMEWRGDRAGIRAKRRKRNPDYSRAVFIQDHPAGDWNRDAPDHSPFDFQSSCAKKPVQLNVKK